MRNEELGIAAAFAYMYRQRNLVLRYCNGNVTCTP